MSSSSPNEGAIEGASSAEEPPTIHQPQPLNAADNGDNNDVDGGDNNNDDNNAAVVPSPKINLRGHKTAPQVSDLDDGLVTNVVNSIDPTDATSIDKHISKKSNKGKLSAPISVFETIVNDDELSEEEKQKAILQKLVDWRYMERTEQEAAKTTNKHLADSVKRGIKGKVMALFVASRDAAAARSRRTRRAAQNEEEEEQDEDMQGRASDEYDRGALTEELRRASGTSSSRRKVDSSAVSLIGQADVVSNEGVERAHTWTAKAMDQMHFPKRTGNEPRRELVLLEFSEVNDTPASGGATAANNIRREKTAITITASSPEAFQYVMTNFAVALGPDEERREQFDVTTLYRDTETNKVIDTVTKFINERRANRQGPSVNNVAPEDIHAGECIVSFVIPFIIKYISHCFISLSANEAEPSSIPPPPPPLPQPNDDMSTGLI